MKNILIINGHSNPNKQKGINHELITNASDFIKTLGDKYKVEVRELMNLYPNFQIDYEKEREYIVNADLVIFQFPIYWYSYPAILKRYVDSIFGPGFAIGEGGDKVKGKKFILSYTLGGRGVNYSKEGHYGYTVEQLTLHLGEGLRYMGVDLVGIIYTTDHSTSDKYNETHKNKLIETIKNNI